MEVCAAIKESPDHQNLTANMVTVETHLFFPSWSCLANTRHCPTGGQLVRTLALLLLILPAGQIDPAVGLLPFSGLLQTSWSTHLSPFILSSLLTFSWLCKLSVVCMDVSSWRNCTTRGNKWQRQNSGRIRKGQGEWNNPKVFGPTYTTTIWMCDWFGLYYHQPKSFNIPLSPQHIVPLLFFLLFCRCCCSLTVGCSLNMS